ncbi:hypothetical protein B0H17DRAFT_1042316 [Mycena rosella]|uniref:O-fucosyltransferase family protein n=1 Tax=Mycena rosella TaxID=1033263 RepID=A0AAD7GNS1_MYCRO|nr:hypothetical protein B0H17DRAFT_1042316 [Mycena rosella]
MLSLNLKLRHWVAFLVGALFLVLYYIYHQYAPPYAIYDALAQSESRASLALVADRNPPKYVFFRQLQGAGFNNQVQEVLLYHHLALLTSRIYVYQPLIWQPRRASLPLSAFLPGVTTESITSAVFDRVCPPSEVTHVSLNVENDIWEHAREVLSRPDKCMVVDDWLFRWTFLASPAIHPIWPSFQHYLSLHFKWSAHILDIAERARPTEPYMALHLRRGDFEDHCRGLASSQTGFTTWATLPGLNDAVFPPSLDPTNYTSVMEHCYPSLRRILDAIDSQARANPHINGLHVLHDGAWDHPLVYLQYFKLEAAVKSPARILRAGWKGGPMKVVTHSGTLPVGRGESDWAVAVDVELAIKASVFIGNGYSSLSSQIVALRLAKDRARTADITLL